MNELRRDPLSGRWVVVAPERARRYEPLERRRAPGSEATCPFCPGHERLTPPEVYASRPRGGGRDEGGWKVRVVPNRHPALRVEGELRREGEGPFDRMSGIGAHEVVIASSRHDESLATMPSAELAEVLWAFAERMRDLSGDVRLESAIAFVDEGLEAGATLAHPHGQLLALPLVPDSLGRELESAAAHWALKQRCLFCDIVSHELRDGRRLVERAEGCVAITPYASRRPFEVWVLPQAHGAHFGRSGRGAMNPLAETISSVLQRLDRVLERPPFHLAIHTAPLQAGELGHYHWHVEIVPVLARRSGLEPGSGLTINPVAPEEAAELLRKASAGR